MKRARETNKEDYSERVTVRLTKNQMEKLGRWAGYVHYSRGDVLRVLLDKWFAHEVSVVQSDKGLK